ncbi:hypothetical protein Xen7305DRAFT_00047730 [Xenococcus sp. PCC 7305]|uniref:DUF4062 domain-containing protein n=1 Tax=Xenococcus sp. PCC 7305 TaxID=102125 RepID=UPI0002ABDD62|nr:DUF4062 domain-containing protein [Xenococcus sp. PCC 7305]ELS05034.1 hypothetical protein Xen7305DRAFT_00047730 [Xenococcus sp. PCC 7305]
MAKIYISSTYSDLKEYREKVYKALRKINHDPRAMEDYVATGKYPPLDKCLSDVAGSDMYVGIFAWRYGYIPTDGNPQRKSITELEYRQALKTDKPCFIFLLDKKAAWLPDQMDKITGDGNTGKCIEELRQELGTDKLVSFFKNPDELAQLVTAAIQNWEKENPDFTPENHKNSKPATTQVIDNSRHVSKGNRTINMGSGNYIKEIKGDYVQGNKTDSSRNINITGGTINASGAGAFSLGDISGTVANTINKEVKNIKGNNIEGDQYNQSGNFGIGHMSGGTIEKGAKVAGVINESSNSLNLEELGINELLTQLKSAILSSPNLNEKSRVKALKQVTELTTAATNPDDEDLKESADNAITMLEGIFSKLPSSIELKKMVSAIAKFFEL